MLCLDYTYGFCFLLNKEMYYVVECPIQEGTMEIFKHLKISLSVITSSLPYIKLQE